VKTLVNHGEESHPKAMTGQSSFGKAVPMVARLVAELAHVECLRADSSPKKKMGLRHARADGVVVHLCDVGGSALFGSLIALARAPLVPQKVTARCGQTSVSCLTTCGCALSELVTQRWSTPSGSLR
jgi:hypothetical protein